MAKDPAFLFYSSDFLTGTMLMDDEQVGKYIRLLCLQHQKGQLSEKDMLKICYSYDDDVFSKFERIENEQGVFFVNKRLDEEVKRRKKYSESRANNRRNKKLDDESDNMNKKTYEKHMKNISNSYDKHMETETENITENITENKKTENAKVEIWPTFNDFWDEYDKKVGSKPKIARKWDKLSQQTKETIMQYLPHYIKSKPDKQYRQNPLTFLNNESWNDEIIQPIQQNTGGMTNETRQAFTNYFQKLTNG